MGVATGATGCQPIFRRDIAAPFRTARLVIWPSFAVPPVVVPLLVAPFLSLLLGVAFVARATPPGPGGRPSPDWEQLIRAHLVRYPLMEPADLYKLLHQTALGSEHAVRDTVAAREWLEAELATMGPGPAEPLVDSLRADGWVVRIHLRPFMAAGGDPEALLQAFIGTGVEQGDREDLRRAGEVAVRLAREKALPWPDSTVSALFAGLAAQGFPAVHHSAVFVEQYRPAYRVVAGKLLRGALPAADTKSRPGAPH
jgi:hypothetical protein